MRNSYEEPGRSTLMHVATNVRATGGVLLTTCGATLPLTAHARVRVGSAVGIFDVVVAARVFLIQKGMQ